MYLDDYNLAATVDFKFTTRNTSAAPTTLAGSPAVSVYQTNSTTQTTTGVTLTADFDGVTGLNHVRIDLSSDGTFYAAGRDFQVVLTAGTVSSVSVVGEVVATFSVLNRSPLRPTTAGRTLDVSAGGEAGLDWANVGSPTTTVSFTNTTIAIATAVSTVATVNALAAGVITAASIAADAITAAKIADGAIDTATFASGTTIPRVTLADTLTTYTGNTVQTGDAYARIGAAGAGLTALGDTRVANLDAAVTSRMATYTQPPGFLAATFPTDPASASTVTGQFAGVYTSLNTIDDFIDTEVAAIKAVTDRLDTALELDGSEYRFTTNALELAPTGGAAPTAAAIADAVWDEARAGHVASGSFGEYIDAAVSSRSTYAGADTPGTATLLTRVTAAVALAADVPTLTQILTTSMTESYAAAGAAPSLAQALFELLANVTEVAFTGAAGTFYKRDHVTPAGTIELDSGTAPTLRKRAT